MKIKIRLHSGRRLWAKAFPTVHPLLFITPAYIKKEYTSTGRSHFSDCEFVITHKRTGYDVCTGTLGDFEHARLFAKFLAESGIPWEKLKSKKDSDRYKTVYAAAKEKFYTHMEKLERGEVEGGGV